MSEEKSRMYTVMNNIPLTTNDEVLQEQQIVYCNTPMNYQQINNPQPYIYPLQLPNSQIVNQYATTSISAPYRHHQQQHMSSSINIPPPLAQPSTLLRAYQK